MGDNKTMNNKTYLELKQYSYSYSPSGLIDSLGFNKALRMACNMLNDEEWDDSLQEYATNVLEKLREMGMVQI